MWDWPREDSVCLESPRTIRVIKNNNNNNKQKKKAKTNKQTKKNTTKTHHHQKKPLPTNKNLKAFSYPLSLTLSGFYPTNGNVNFGLQYLFRIILQIQKHRQSYCSQLAFCGCYNPWHLLQRTDFSRHYPLVFSQVIHLQQSASLTSGQAHCRLSQACRNGEMCDWPKVKKVQAISNTQFCSLAELSHSGVVCQNGLRRRWGLENGCVDRIELWWWNLPLSANNVDEQPLEN